MLQPFPLIFAEFNRPVDRDMGRSQARACEGDGPEPRAPPVVWVTRTERGVTVGREPEDAEGAWPRDPPARTPRAKARPSRRGRGSNTRFRNDRNSRVPSSTNPENTGRRRAIDGGRTALRGIVPRGRGDSIRVRPGPRGKSSRRSTTGRRTSTGGTGRMATPPGSLLHRDRDQSARTASPRTSIDPDDSDRVRGDRVDLFEVDRTHLGCGRPRTGSTGS